MNYQVQLDGRTVSVKNLNRKNNTVEINGEAVPFDFRRVHGDLYSLLVNGEVYSVQVQEREGAQQIRLGPQVFNVTIAEERQAVFKKLQAQPKNPSGLMVMGAPMPGLVMRLEVQKGERVEKGQALIVIEAMKMENEIKSPVAGTIAEILIAARASVEKDAPLFKIQT